MNDPQDDPQDDPAGISRVAECIKKVLATIEYMFGLFDSKLIVNKSFRKNNNKGGGALLIRGGDYIYIYIYIYMYTYIYIYIYIYSWATAARSANPAARGPGASSGRLRSLLWLLSL